MTEKELKDILEDFIKNQNKNVFPLEIRNILLQFKNAGGQQKTAQQILEQLKQNHPNNEAIHDNVDDILDIVTGWTHPDMRVWD